MAIYHFTVAVLSRSRGHRIVAAAAAQAAVKLRDHYYGTQHNHTRRPGVEFTEIIASEDAPAWVFDRETLWNRVEAAERRQDAQLARAVEFSLPVELEHAQRIELLRDFVRAEFVAQGMIADAGIRRSKLDNPNAHVLLTLRTATAAGFGPKVRQWNGKSNLLNWRAAWASRANLHLARAGHALRIDHRTLEAQRVELTPARKTGLGRPLHDVEALPEHLQVRFVEQRRIAHANGAAIIEDPAIAVRALAHQRGRFTQAQISQFLRTRTDGDVQREAALSAVMNSPELIALSPTGRPAEYTSRDLMEAEKSLLRRALRLAARRRGAPALQTAGIDAAEPSGDARMPEAWPSPLRGAFSYVIGAGDFKAVALLDAQRAELVPAARAHWQAQGRRVLEDAAPQDAGADDVLVVPGAEMIDLKSLERILEVAERVRAKLVLLVEAANLQALGANSPMHALMQLGWRAGA